MGNFPELAKEDENNLIKLALLDVGRVYKGAALLS